MLQHLEIHNYALIKELNIDFSSGFSVITGETGAGKSIILGALGLLSGQRVDSKHIKSDTSKCIIEGVFNIDNLDLEEWFNAHHLDFDPNECTLRREVNISGKSRAFINDTPVGLVILKDLSNKLFDIHSQHQNLLITHESFLIDTLDTIAQSSESLEKYQTIYKKWIQEKNELEKIKENYTKSKEKIDYISFLLSQLSEAHLQKDELTELEQEYKILNHTEDIKNNLFLSASILNQEEYNPIEKLQQIQHFLENISSVFSTADLLSSRINAIKIDLQDINNEIEQQLDNIDFDPKRQEFLEERLNIIYSLLKKFNVKTVEDLLEKEKKLSLELEQIENLDNYIIQKEKCIDALYSNLWTLGNKISKKREEAAIIIENEITQKLYELGMPSVKLHFDFIKRTTPHSLGIDLIHFLFSANKNTPEQDIIKTASGGEVARVMLTLKELLSYHRALPTIIFDEIDTGVSGHIAEKMGNVMKNMSRNCQVLCITHLPQIAASGDSHYFVYKEEHELYTTSKIKKLNTNERITEIAHMLSGIELTEAAIQNAKTLFKNKK